MDGSADELRQRVEEQRRRLVELHAHHREQLHRSRVVRATIREQLELFSGLRSDKPPPRP